MKQCACIEEAGGKAASVQVDVTKRDDLERMVAFAEETFGGIDIFHNNAGIGTPQPRFPAAKQDLWERTLNIDLWAVIAGVQAVVPAMQRRGGGVIVNTASIAGPHRPLAGPHLRRRQARRRRPHALPRLPPHRSEYPRELHLPRRRRYPSGPRHPE